MTSQSLVPGSLLLLAAATGLGYLVSMRSRKAAADATATDARSGRSCGLVLGVLACLAFTTYVGSGGFAAAGGLHKREWVHYYLGSKYAVELSYDRLYQCIVVAGDQDGLTPPLTGRVRDLRTNAIVSVNEVLADPHDCTSHFSASRWTEFRNDVRYLRGQIATADWNLYLLDHGYNATPVWTVAGALLTNTVPASGAQLVMLSMLDPLYLLAMFLAIAWAFGWRTLTIGVLVLATFVPAGFEHTGRAFLRWDWLFFTVAGICLLKKDKPLLAGTALGYAALLRVFPAVLFAGPMFAIIWQILRHRNIDRAHLRLLSGGTLSAAALVPASLFLTGGASTYVAFAGNLIKTQQTPFGNAIGLPAVLRWRPHHTIRDLIDPQATDPLQAWRHAARQAGAVMSPLRVLMAVLVVAALVLAARTAVPWVAAALGLTILPVVTDLLGYYYMLIIAVALLCHARERLAVWLLGLCVVSQFVALAPFPGMPTAVEVQYPLISAATVVVFAAILLQHLRFRQVDTARREGVPEPCTESPNR